MSIAIFTILNLTACNCNISCICLSDLSTCPAIQFVEPCNRSGNYLCFYCGQTSERCQSSVYVCSGSRHNRIVCMRPAHFLCVTPDRRPWSSKAVWGSPLRIPKTPAMAKFRNKQPSHIQVEDIIHIFQTSYTRAELRSFACEGCIFAYSYNDKEGKSDRGSIEKHVKLLQGMLQLNATGVFLKSFIEKAIVALEQKSELSLSQAEDILPSKFNRYVDSHTEHHEMFEDVQDVSASVSIQTH